jgi:hypothetical protein
MELLLSAGFVALFWVLYHVYAMPGLDMRMKTETNKPTRKMSSPIAPRVNAVSVVMFSFIEPPIPTQETAPPMAIRHADTAIATTVTVDPALLLVPFIQTTSVSGFAPRAAEQSSISMRATHNPGI